MQITREKAASFHCPRWNELPGIPLYMDQVILVLDESLALFAEEDGHVVTATMINNYVKQKVIIPPGGKRYGREQMATLIMLCLLKRVFSINETMGLIGLFTENAALGDAYDVFCAEFEAALTNTFSGDDGEEEAGFDAAGETRGGRTAIAALAGKLHAQGVIATWQEKQKATKELLAKEKKTEGKK